MNSQRVLYFDALRILAIISVIVLHVAAKGSETEVNSLVWKVCMLYRCAIGWGVPLFVMISGALFLGKQQSLRRIIHKHIFKIVICFLFWSCLYAVWQYFVVGTITTVNDLVGAIIIGRFHLWFLPMIVGLYLIVPFLNIIVSNRLLTKYFLILSFLFAFLLPESIRVLEVNHHGLAEAFSKALNNMNFHFVLGYSSYYILGYLLHVTEIRGRYESIIYISGVVGLLFTIGATKWASRTLNTLYSFYGYFDVNTLAISASLFLLAKNHLNFENYSINRRITLGILSKCSFGVYLIHIMILDFFQYILNITILSYNPVYLVPILSVTVVLISTIIAYGLNKIPFVNKWLV